MEKRLIKFFKMVDWKSVAMITGAILVAVLLPITLLSEKPTVAANKQETYSLRNNLITIIALLLRLSDNSTFFKSFAATPNFLALIIIIINVIAYTFLAVLYSVPLKTRSLRLLFLILFLTIIVIIKLIIYILLMIQKENELYFFNYVYIFQKIKLQPLYFLPLIGYIFYFLSLVWYFSKLFVKRNQLR